MIYLKSYFQASKCVGIEEEKIYQKLNWRGMISRDSYFHPRSRGTAARSEETVLLRSREAERPTHFALCIKSYRGRVWEPFEPFLEETPGDTGIEAPRSYIELRWVPLRRVGCVSCIGIPLSIKKAPERHLECRPKDWTPCIPGSHNKAWPIKSDHNVKSSCLS